MIDVNPNQPLQNVFAWPQLEQLYNNIMDGSFFTLSRDIVLHLTPIRTAASGLVVNSNPAFQINPYYGRSLRPAPNTVSTSRQPAARHIYRDVTYKAHIRHGPKELSDKDVIGRLEVDEVATTTVVEATSHINEAESVTIDGNRYRLHKGPRPVGWKDKRYVITVWKEIPEEENG